MAKLFKQKYMFIYIFLSIFHFITNQFPDYGETLIISNGDKKWDFTLSNTEVGRKFYEKIKNSVSLDLTAITEDGKDSLNVDVYSNDLLTLENSLSFGQIQLVPGDIAFTFSGKLCFIAKNVEYTAFKVGEIQE